jgi:hypothetical protein
VKERGIGIMGKVYSDETIEALRNRGYFRFVAIFTCTHQEDNEVRTRLLQFSKEAFTKVGIPWETSQGYYLTGARTVLVIGYVKSPAALQAFCSLVIMNTAIQGTFYHAMETNELGEVGLLIADVLGAEAKVGQPFNMRGANE